MLGNLLFVAQLGNFVAFQKIAPYLQTRFTNPVITAIQEI